jgi:hypothetical protein
VGDFIGSRITRAFPAVVSNPPYIRHHRLSESRKNELRALALQCLGFALDGRVGLHFYFLLKCLEHLASGGRLAFLVPADVCEGVSSAAAWRRLGERFRIDAVLIFGEAAAPFPSVDTNALVLLLSRQKPADRVRWLRVLRPDPDAILTALTCEEGDAVAEGSVSVQWRTLAELLHRECPPHNPAGSPAAAARSPGLCVGSPPGPMSSSFTPAQVAPAWWTNGTSRPLAARAIVHRCADANAPGSPGHASRPTWLLRLRRVKILCPHPCRPTWSTASLGLHERPLIKTRRPGTRWNTLATPLLFAYLRRRLRFILSSAGVVPSCFLYVYPWEDDQVSVERLWRA